MTIEDDSEITKYLFNDDEEEGTRQVYEKLQSMVIHDFSVNYGV